MFGLEVVLARSVAAFRSLFHKTYENPINNPKSGRNYSTHARTQTNKQHNFVPDTGRYTWSTAEVHTRVWWRSLSEKDHLESTGIDGRVIIQRIFMKCDGEA